LAVLKSGYLLSSAKTKNIQLFGNSNGDGAGSPYIFLRLQRKGDAGTFYLDYKLLLETKFYLHIGWKGEPEGKIIDGTKLTEIELKELLDDFGKKVDENYKNASKRNGFTLPRIMSNEILVANDIDLHKYLRKIYAPYSDIFTEKELAYRLHWACNPVQRYWRNTNSSPTPGGLIIQC
jgi:hypothetical protein